MKISKTNIDGFYKKMTAKRYRESFGLDQIYYVMGKAITCEDDMCIVFKQWFDTYIREPFGMIHIPNGGSRNAFEGAKLKRMGVRAGTPDYLMMLDGRPVGFMEFKFGKNRLTYDQLDFKRYVDGKFPWAEIRSFEEFRKTLLDWGFKMK